MADPLVQALADAQTVCRAELDAWLASADSAALTFDQAQPIVDALVSKYGDIASTVAADWYEAQLAEWGMDAVATLGEVDRAALAANTQWALKPATDADTLTADIVAAVGSRLGSVSKRHVLQAGWDTVGASSRASKLRFARVTDGSCCAWCSMLASRGAVYWSKGTAMSGTHSDCGCHPKMIHPGETVPHEQAHLDLYQAGRDAIPDDTARIDGRTDLTPTEKRTRQIVAGMRRVSGSN